MFDFFDGRLKLFLFELTGFAKFAGKMLPKQL